MAPGLASQPIFFDFFPPGDDFRAPKRSCGIPDAYLFMTEIEHFLFCDSRPHKRKNTLNGPCLPGSDGATLGPLNEHLLPHQKRIELAMQPMVAGAGARACLVGLGARLNQALRSKVGVSGFRDFGKRARSPSAPGRKGGGGPAPCGKEPTRWIRRTTSGRSPPAHGLCLAPAAAP